MAKTNQTWDFLLSRLVLIGFVFGFSFLCLSQSALSEKVENEVFQVFNARSVNEINYFHINSSTLNAHKVYLNLEDINITDLTEANIVVETSIAENPFDEPSIEIDCPVVFSLRHRRNARSWAVPLAVSRDHLLHKPPLILYNGSRTVCIDDGFTNVRHESETKDYNDYEDGDESRSHVKFTILASTCSPKNVTYSLKIIVEDNPMTNHLSTFTLKNIELSPSITRFYKFEFNDGSERVIIEMDSDDENCMTMAVQSPWCSLINTDTDATFERNGVEFQKLWQDTTKKGIITVSKSDFKDGFFLAFAVHANDKSCEHYNGVSSDKWSPIKQHWGNSVESAKSQNRTKIINITVHRDVKSRVNTVSLFYPVFFLMIIVGLTAIIFSIFENSRFPYLGQEEEQFVNVSNSNIPGRSRAEGDSTYLLNDDEVDSIHQNSQPYRNGPTNESRIHDDGARGSIVDEIEEDEEEEGRRQRPIATISRPSLDDLMQFDENQSTFQIQGETNGNYSGHLSLEVAVDAVQNNDLVDRRVNPASLTSRQDVTQRKNMSKRIPTDNSSSSSSSSSNRNTNENRPHRQPEPQLQNNTSRSNPNKRWLTIQDFIHKTKKLTSKTMDRIYLLIVTVGIFYGLPTVQLLITYRQIKSSTGESDLCYQNFMCSKLLYGLEDANHILSNVPYILLGITFLIFVGSYGRKIRRIEEQRLLLDLPASSQSVVGYGVIHQFGVFTALGLSLILEGILSGLYHVCPSPINFQFDTSFMYFLAVMTGIKIYQFRHWNPVCSLNTIGFLGVITFISVGGIILGNAIYQALFFLFHFSFVIIMSIYMYYIGHIRDEDGNTITSFVEMLKTVRIQNSQNSLGRYFCSCFSPSYAVRLLYVIPFALLNVAVDVWQFYVKVEFPTYLLYLFAGNMMWYFIYYLFMKIFHWELFNRRSLQPMIYLLLSFVLTVVAGLFFLDKRYDTNLSPAQSRTLNRKCELGIWDTHDIWHCLSAGGIFLFFMALLTLDDALLYTPRTEIVAF